MKLWLLGAAGVMLLGSTVYLGSVYSRHNGRTAAAISDEIFAAQRDQIVRLKERLQALEHGTTLLEAPTRDSHAPPPPPPAEAGAAPSWVEWHRAPPRHTTPAVVSPGMPAESTHTCYGRTYNDDYWVENTCVYHNLVYSVDDHAFIYVAHDKAHAAMVRESGDLVVSTYPQGFSSRVGPVLEEGKLVPTVISKAEFAAKYGKRGMVEVKNVHVIYESYNAENFGHFLTDELYPAFSALSSFDLVQPDIQLLRRVTTKKWRYSCDWQVANWGKEQGEKCARNYEAFTPLMSTNPVLKLREYAKGLVSRHLPAGKQSGALINLGVAVSGFGMLADHCDDPTTHGRRIGSPSHAVHHNCNRGRQLQLVNFRKWTLQMIGVDPALQPKVQQVLIWDRAASDYKANRKINGFDKLKKRIETEFKIKVVLYESWLGKSAKYQLQTMAESTVFITGVGSGSHIGWYLPRGGTMVRVCNKNAEPTHMEWHIFNYMPHFQVEYVEADKGKFDEELVMTHVVAGLNRYALENGLPTV